jgi:ubiquinol-cytochrome c reductase cytochrome b subunit
VTEAREYGLVVPARRDPWPNLGWLALLVAGGGLVTGVFLAFNYAPTLDAARDSVAYIQEQVTLGWFLRGLHHWSGAFAIVLAALHGWRLFWHGAYKTPRRLLWVLGGLTLLVLVGFAYTGYLLPGDERAQTGLGVMAGVAGATPGVGDAATVVLQGGDAVSSAMLARLYALHAVVLPAALLILVGAFVAVWRRRGPARHHADPSDEVTPAWPGALTRDARAAAVVLVLLALCAWLFPPGLGPKPDAAGAAAPDARPEWFLLWVNELMWLAQGQTFLVGGLLPGLLVALALGLPLLARGTARDPARRKPEIIGAVAILGCLGGLTVSSLLRAAPAEAAEPGPTSVAAPAGDLDAQVGAVLEKYRCTSCHSIDGGEAEDETGPPLHRRGAGDKPPFATLYTRELFRRKVADPKRFWPDSGMYYTPKRRKPTAEELALLERWFFLDDAR